MKIFNYKALSKEKRTMRGYVEAGSEDLAAEILRDKGFLIISLDQVEDKPSRQWWNVLGTVKQKDIVIFSRQFAVLVSANVSLVQSLRILTDQTQNVKLKMLISELADDVEGGTRLSEALAKRDDVFTDFFINVVKSGETSGKLDEVLNYLADEMEKDYDMTSKIKGAMIYPIFVMSGLVIVGILMMIFVIPKLTVIFEEAGGELPLSTRILIGSSDFMQQFWYVLLLTPFVIIGLFLYLKSLPFGKKMIDQIKLNLPIFGPLLRKIYIVRFTRSMETLITGGVNISKSLQISANVVNNEVYKELILQTKKEVEDGNSISDAFEESEEVPKMVSKMMHIGEKTGRMDMVLSKISDFFMREINNTVANLMTLMEPIIIVIMALCVGVMVAAIIMPMYSITATY